MGVDDNDYLDKVVSCKGKLYASFHYKRKLVSVDVDEADKLRIQLLCETPVMPAIVFVVYTYMIESGGELFYIFIAISGSIHEKSNQVIEVHVFRLDFATMVWNRAENLMGQSFFIDHFHKFSCPAIESEQDNIYFIFPKDRALYSFNIRDGWLSVTLPCPRLPTPWSNPMFFRPDPRSNSHCDSIEFKRDKEEKDMLYVEEIEGAKALSLGNLPLDVLNSVANCFISSNNIFDFMNFRYVCRDFWLAAPKLNLQKLQISLGSPWLQFHTNNRRVQNFVDTKYGSKFLMRMIVPNSLANTRLRYSKDGWLLMSDSDGGNSMSFYNPFMEQVIDLPDIPREFGRFCSMWFSSIPTSPDCVVMGFASRPLTVTLFTMKHKEWHLIVLDEDDYEFFLNCSSPVFHRGAFHLLGK